MRIRLTDGTREVEVEADDGAPQALEATALRLFQATHPGAEDMHHRFGFARQLDGVSLDSQTERAEPYDNHRFEDDDE